MDTCYQNSNVTINVPIIAYYETNGTRYAHFRAYISQWTGNLNQTQYQGMFEDYLATCKAMPSHDRHSGEQERRTVPISVSVGLLRWRPPLMPIPSMAAPTMSAADTTGWSAAAPEPFTSRWIDTRSSSASWIDETPYIAGNTPGHDDLHLSGSWPGNNVGSYASPTMILSGNIVRDASFSTGNSKESSVHGLNPINEVLGGYQGNNARPTSLKSVRLEDTHSARLRILVWIESSWPSTRPGTGFWAADDDGTHRDPKILQWLDARKVPYGRFDASRSKRQRG